MKASLIISYYKNLPDLELILLALNLQSFDEFEAIISEDDDSIVTVNFLQQMRPWLKFPVQHYSQKNDGFRKCAAMNASVSLANNGLLIFIDGDCIPHRHFIKEYVKAAEGGKMLIGRRVMLSKKLTDRLRLTKNLSILGLWSLLLSGSKRVEDGIYRPNFNSHKKRSGIIGCNWAIQKADLLKVNGFDEDYIMPCYGEDSDVEWRLVATGCSFKAMKQKAIVYHLHHGVGYINDEKTHPNLVMMRQKIKAGAFFCKNGLQKI